MPLDVKLVREGVSWSRNAAVAFREGVQELEDHLLSVGVDDADLAVSVRRGPGGSGDVHLVLTLGEERLHHNADDQDLALALRSGLDRLRAEASVERVAEAVGEARPAPDNGPWEDVRSRLVALAMHAITRAVETDDLPAGIVDADDLVDDALVAALEGAAAGGPHPPFRELRLRVYTELARRIDEARDREDDVDLDSPATDRDSAPMTAVEDEMYEYLQPDEVPDRMEDVLVDPKLRS